MRRRMYKEAAVVNQQIYVDAKGHLMCADLDRLHSFARRIGLWRSWFQHHPRHPHYDLTTMRKMARAIKAGAIPVTTKEMLKATQRKLPL